MKINKLIKRSVLDFVLIAVFFTISRRYFFMISKIEIETREFGKDIFLGALIWTVIFFIGRIGWWEEKMKNWPAGNICNGLIIGLIGNAIAMGILLGFKIVRLSNCFLLTFLCVIFCLGIFLISYFKSKSANLDFFSPLGFSLGICSILGVIYGVKFGACISLPFFVITSILVFISIKR